MDLAVRVCFLFLFLKEKNLNVSKRMSYIVMMCQSISLKFDKVQKVNIGFKRLLLLLLLFFFS